MNGREAVERLRQAAGGDIFRHYQRTKRPGLPLLDLTPSTKNTVVEDFLRPPGLVIRRTIALASLERVSLKRATNGNRTIKYVGGADDGLFALVGETESVRYKVLRRPEEKLGDTYQKLVKYHEENFQRLKGDKTLQELLGNQE